MQKKKKVTNKENLKFIKKVPLVTIPSFNYTEEIRIPSLNSTQLKNMVKSIDLRKSAMPNPYKKTISRKSTSKSIKQNPNYRPPQIKTLMKTFKQLKLLHENQRSKSKSPASCKSRSTKKYFPNKKSYHTLKTNPTSEINLTLKLEKTIKKLNQADFFRDEDSLLPIKSSSDIMNQNQQSNILITQHEEQINISQLREYCSTANLSEKKQIGLSTKGYNFFKENTAALKIQRAWKRYQTKRLIERYAFICQQEQSSELNIENIYATRAFTNQQDQQLNVNISHEIVIPSQQFYEQNHQQNNKVRHISNLEQEAKSVSSDYQEIVKKMKMEELQKWNQIIKIISLNKSDNPQELERLLQKLTQQSQNNKKDLEEKASNIIAKSNKKKHLQRASDNSIEQNQDKKIQEDKDQKRQSYRSSSDPSQGMEQYDSKKYIEYLDGDIFPNQHDVSSNSSRNAISNKHTISKRKQDLLLQQLKTSNLPIKLGQTDLYRSESMKSLQYKQHKRQISKSSSRSQMKKSTSEKILKRTIHDMTENQMMQLEEEINLDLLTRQFLQGEDPHSQNFQMVYSQERLRSKLAELNKMKQQNIFDQQHGSSQNQQIYERVDQEEEIQLTNQLKRSDPVLVLHQKSIKQDIKIQDESPEKLKIQLIQSQILSDSDELTEEQNEKGQTISTIILNNLILQVLKDIAKIDKLSTAFKNYTINLKPKIRKSENNKKQKKGFPTSKAQIQLFLDGLIKYLNKQEPNVFKNLQISTGPSAIQMLRYMHQTGEQSLSVGQSDQDQSNVMVIPNKVFDAFWLLKEKSIVIQLPQSFDQSNSIIFKHQFQLLKSFNKIFYRSLFDTLNQCLDCQRNFGQYGRPFPWKKAPVFYHIKNKQTIQAQVKSAQKKMIDLSTSYCGLIIEKQQMVSINEQYIKQVHQDRLSRMLAADLIQSEERWMFYDDQETEILVEMSNAVYTELLIQIIEEIYEYF